MSEDHGAEPETSPTKLSLRRRVLISGITAALATGGGLLLNKYVTHGPPWLWFLMFVVVFLMPFVLSWASNRDD